MSGSTDDVKPVNCTIKPPVYLQIGDVKTEASHSGVCVVDVTLPFGKPVNVSCQLLQKAVDLMQNTSGVHANHHIFNLIIKSFSCFIIFYCFACSRKHCVNDRPEQPSTIGTGSLLHC